jgi:hypothetical protein
MEEHSNDFTQSIEPAVVPETSSEQLQEPLQPVQAKKVSKYSPTLVIAGIAVLVIASFLGGTSYQKHKTSSENGVLGVNTGPQGPQMMGGGPNAGDPRNVYAGGTVGSVTAVSKTSISVRNNRPTTGTAPTYKITSVTKITKNGTAISADQIHVGDRVSVRTNPSDTATATQILVAPQSAPTAP